MTLDSEIAEDLSQDTMLRLFKNLPRLSFENTRCFWAWVYKTALNRIRDFYDEQQVRRLRASLPDGGADTNRCSSRTVHRPGSHCRWHPAKETGASLGSWP